MRRKGWKSEMEPMYLHPDAVPAVSTPCSDGERVVAYFGDLLVGLDLDGKELWKRSLPNPGYGFGVGNSPLLFDGLLVLPRDGAPEAALSLRKYSRPRSGAFALLRAADGRPPARPPNRPSSAPLPRKKSSAASCWRLKARGGPGDEGPGACARATMLSSSSPR